MRRIIGAGGDSGGGSTQRAPEEQADNLQSKAYAKIIDLISEGEIVGLVDGDKSIYFDGTPLQSASGSYNFSRPKVGLRVGTQAQDHIPGFSASENEIQVGVECLEDIGIVRTVTNNSVDAVRVRISIPQLTFQDSDTGDLQGSTVRYIIQRQSNGGGYQTVVDDTIRGKSTSKYERSYRVELTGESPWDIRVIRQSEDSTSIALQNKTFWESYTEIVDGKLRYPNSAIVAIEIDASQFSSIPTRGYDIKGLKVKVPSNYNPETRVYTGSWDGTFNVAYTSNPAWIFYDILTANRYGLGNFVPAAQVDKWALYQIGRYCDELVPDGLGGTEPRFTCNTYLQSREEAFKVIQDMASVFRGMVYWSGGLITAVQDAPDDAAHLFTAANVVDGIFSYSGSSAKARHSVAQVTWNDPEDLYRQKVEYVEDVDAIARFGVIETQVSAFACTSRGQANRVGRWLLFSEQYQTEIVSFKTGIEGALIRPGQVIKVSDPARAGERRGGRIVAASTTSVTLDQTVSIDPATHSLSVLLADGTVEERAVQSATGSVISLATAFSSAPQVGSLWMLQSSSIEPQLFRILSVTESEGVAYEVTALAHNPGKYDAVEFGLKLEPRSISSLNEIPDAPTGIKFVETLYEVNGDVRVKVTVSWNAVRGASSYLASYVRDTGNEIFLPSTPTNEVEILNAEPGTYTVTIFAVNPLGARSVAGTGTGRILGKANPPSNVTGFSLMPLGNAAFLSWDKSTDLDVLRGGYVRIRHSPDIVAPLWRNSVDIGPALAGSSTRAQLPLLVGSYLAKFVDSSGNASNDAAIIVTTVPEALALNVVNTSTENPAFSGARNSMEYSADLVGLVLSAAFLIDDVADIDSIGAWDFAGGVATLGTYTFASAVDLTEVYTSRVTARIVAEAVDVSDTIDLRFELIDDWLDLDGDFIDDVNAELFMQTTEDDPASGGAVWTDWKRFFVGDYAARGFRFQLRATSAYESHNIVIKELSVTIDMPDRVVNLAGLSSGAATYSVAFPEPFAAVPALGITPSNLNSGDYWVIANKTRAGFDITFRNSSGVAVARTFDVLAKGYGRQLS